MTVDTALHIAAQEGHLDVTKYLISQGAEVNNGRCITLSFGLHFTVQLGIREIMTMVILMSRDISSVKELR